MRNRYAGLAMVGVAAAATLYLTHESFMGSVVLNQSTFSEEEQAFVKFMSHHRKSYGTKEEYDFRLNIFRKTLERRTNVRYTSTHRTRVVFGPP